MKFTVKKRYFFGWRFQSVEYVFFNEGADDFSWISTEREKQIVLRASRLMRGRRVRLLRSRYSMCWMKIPFLVTCLSFVADGVTLLKCNERIPHN